jgi:predicted transcriptional regulator of viral defense system
MKYLEILLKSGKTVFTYDDIRVFFGIEKADTIKKILNRLVKSGILQHIAHGIFALPHYQEFEFATLFKKNSYISFETVLKKEGIIFQHYGNTIFLATDRTLTKRALNITFECHKLRDDILYNPLGIIQTGSYAIATAERAVCDRLYLSPSYYFDNLTSLDEEKLLTIAELYNKSVVLSVKNLLRNAQ